MGETANESVGMISTLLPAAAIGELSNRLTRTREQSSTQVSGPVTGFPLISAEVVLAILAVHASASQTLRFRVPSCKAQSPKNVLDRSRLHPHHQLRLRVRHLRPHLRLVIAVGWPSGDVEVTMVRFASVNVVVTPLRTARKSLSDLIWM